MVIRKGKEMDSNNIGKKIDNTKLVNAMRTMRANEDQDSRREFFQAIAPAMLIIPVNFDKDPEVDEEGRIVPGNGVKINFALLTNTNGDKVFPCFTDDETINASQFNEGFKRIILPYKELASFVLKSNGAVNGIAVNPFTENCFISGEFIKLADEQAKKGPLTQTKIAPGAKIKLRTPKYQPVQMLDVASKFLAGHDNVSKAYIQMMEEPEKEDKYLMALEINGDEKHLLTELIPLLKPHSFGIELAFVTTDNALGEKVAELTEPFYTKEGLDDNSDPQDKE